MPLARGTGSGRRILSGFIPGGFRPLVRGGCVTGLRHGVAPRNVGPVHQPPGCPIRCITFLRRCPWLLPLLALGLLGARTWVTVPVAMAAPKEKGGRAVLRCGWFDNPTPGNAWLTDKDGVWTVALQGQHEAHGDWPVFRPREWVSTNGHHGHGCACLRVVNDAGSNTILRILSARSRPLGQCRSDRALHEPGA